MANDFNGRWASDSNKVSTSQKIKETVAPQGDLRKKLGETERSLASQIVKLDRNAARMGEKEKVLFAKTTAAFQRHDTAQAQSFANELAELRKAMKLVNGAKLSLERVQVRLKTITDIGDLAMVLAPVGQVVRSVRQTLMTVMPGANDTMGEITTTLDGLMQEVGNVPSMSMSFDTSSEEAEKILAEASVVAETKMASTLPNIPDVEETATSDTSI